MGCLEKEVDKRNLNEANVTRLRFNGEETSIMEVIKKCTPILDAYYNSLQPIPRTNAEKCLALQIELGSSWTPHLGANYEWQKELLEIHFLTKRGNIYFPHEQRQI